MGINVIVTGGAGFLGWNLCKKLLEGPVNKVVCIDNFSTNNRYNEVKQLALTDHRFRYFSDDVTSPQISNSILVKRHFPDGVDQIYHLACPASPPKYQQDPIKTMLTSVVGTNNVCKLALRYNARLLFTSTSEIYGDPLLHPQREEYRGNVNSIGPRACYDEGKRAAESLCYDYARTEGLDIRVARIFNTYGPYMDPDDGRVVSNLIYQCFRNKNITMFGDGKQTRSFCYVDDQIRGLISLMNLTNVSCSTPINIGNPTEHTMIELAAMIKKLMGSTSEITYKPLPVDDPTQRRPNIDKAVKYLEWYPKIDLEAGLVKTIKYFKGILGNDV
jgi:UDP-glucuronate decarboxylase